MATIVDDRGRVLIPRDLREAAGIEPGARVRIEMDQDGDLRVRMTLEPEAFLDRLRGGDHGCEQTRRCRADRPAGGQAALGALPVILPDANIWIYSIDAGFGSEHEAAVAWLSRWLPKEDLLVPTIVETEVVHYLARQLEASDASAAVSSFLAHPGTFSPLASWVNREAADLLIRNPERGIGGRDAAFLVHAKQHDATVVTHDQRLLEVASDWGLDAHDPIA